PRRHTPWVAALASFVLAAILVPVGELRLVASLSSLASLAAFAAVNLAVILLRYRQPRLRRPFKVPLTVRTFPILPAVGTLAAVGLATQLPAPAYAAGAGLLLMVAVLSSLAARSRNTRGR
ncbi:MAG: hypothetical protein ACRDF6_07245, partial [bacterium]